MSLSLYADYEQILLGNKKFFSQEYFDHGEYQRQHNSILLFKYAFENQLRWNPEDVRDNITLEIIEKKLKLGQPLKSIHFPPELDKYSSLWYLAHLVYPERIEYDWYGYTINYYESVANGCRRKFSKGFFDHSDGAYRACFCLRHRMDNSMIFRKIEDVYAAFSDPAVIKTITSWKLDAPLKLIYNNIPIDYLQDSLSEDDKDDFWYIYYKFKYFENRDFPQISEMLWEDDGKVTISDDNIKKVFSLIKDCSFRAGTNLPDGKKLMYHAREAPGKFASFLLWITLTADEPDVEDPDCLKKDETLRLVKKLAAETIVLVRGTQNNE